MDPELRAYLEAKRAETKQQVEAMEKCQSVNMDALDTQITAWRREMAVMLEIILNEIRALPERLAAYQRQKADRLDATRDQAMLNGHVLPLEAVAADHEERIRAVEQAH